MKRSKVVVLGSSLFAALGLLSGPVAYADSDSPSAKLKKMDSNGDGKVSADEHAKFATEHFREIDTNKDGVVSVSELDAVRELGGKAGPKQMSGTEKLKTMDTNGDGKVSADEYSSAKRAWFDEADINRDGTLSEMEISAGMSKSK